MDKELHLLLLGLRWFAHDLASPLSIVGAAREDDALASQAQDQLIALTRLVQTIGVMDEADKVPDHFRGSLDALAQARNVELSYHIASISVRQAAIMAALCLAVMPRLVSGKIILALDNTKLIFEASGLSPEAMAAIETGLKQDMPAGAQQIPLYIAGRAGRDITIARLNDGLRIEMKARD